MAIYGEALTLHYVAWDTNLNAGKTGDADNHTIYLVRDGTAVAATGTPTEVDATNAPGLYSLPVSAAEMQVNCMTLAGKSSTSNVEIIPVTVLTERGKLDAIAKMLTNISQGVGTETYIYEVTDKSTGEPIADCYVFVYTSADRDQRLATAKTNSSGKATFFLDPGIYYAWRQHPLYTFEDPDTLTVEAS